MGSSNKCYLLKVSVPTLRVTAFSHTYWKKGIRKKAILSGLQEFLSEILPSEEGLLYFLSKKTWGLNIKYWYWPVLAKQPINAILIILKDWCILTITKMFVEYIFLSCKQVLVVLEDVEFFPVNLKNLFSF